MSRNWIWQDPLGRSVQTILGLPVRSVNEPKSEVVNVTVPVGVFPSNPVTVAVHIVNDVDATDAS